ncbi:amino acid adenylation domain-containing protein [Actinomycetospora endophytica]|uniref:Amino acid adenylation domain-containing protein n=1 Tax=Actinomycetospora endophytica TaxID=2291215 RepID=A0ABS8PA49_9PSEU|nr:Pls/PosA family non-ribosomal peptide synthetase [Actinomycetospora endophytica]MCD2195119.1 amino acid adenylation domain-containing protein [Actinomycetospora endophytica]
MHPVGVGPAPTGALPARTGAPPSPPRGLPAPGAPPSPPHGFAAPGAPPSPPGGVPAVRPDADSPTVRRPRRPAVPPPGAVHLGGSSAPPRTLLDVLATTAAAYPDRPAIDDGTRTLDYAALRSEANRVAVLLAAHGVGRGDRVGIRVASGTADLYVAVLGVLAVGAAYVPVDAEDPADRADLVFARAEVRGVLTDAETYETRRGGPPALPPGRPLPSDDAWIIFTSGTTGTPKGVAVSHRSAAAFVDAEARLFLRHRPLGPGDRVMASLSVGFDASCEEMWLAWRHGACLVPAPRSLVRSGAEIGDWLAARDITVVSTVPTLAGLWSAEQCRGLRLLILGGEACPDQLAHRLAAVCDEVWNTYGPTETTVVACASRLRPGEPVRIGLPLAGWQLAVVDPERGHPVRPGEVGELVIAGVGTARYLDPEKDAAAFRPLPALGWGRAYRSGDLVRADREGLTYVGRADSQVKIRGFRVELGEIEAVLGAVPGVAQAVVATHTPSSGVTELVGYYRVQHGVAVDEESLAARLRSALPAHMVPAYFQRLAEIPMMSSGKVDRAALPAPAARRGGAPGTVVAPATRTEESLAAAFAGVLDLERVSVESHLVDDLGANSLTLARVAAALRRDTDLPPVPIRLMYAHPTVRSLAAALAQATPGAAVGLPEHPPEPRVGTWMHRACGVLQLLVLAALALGGVLIANVDVDWVGPSQGFGELYLRVLAALAASGAVVCLLPIAAKWLLVGRCRPDTIRLWSLAYVRFWTVATLIRSCPLALFAGSPIYVLYLRALGARIGRGAVILSTTVPVCPDLIEIGDGAVVRRSVAFTGYQARAGALRTGRVRIGADAVVGEGSLLEIDTVVGDGARLAHASSVHTGQRVPDGRHWHGSPARPADHAPPTLPSAHCPRRRRVVAAVSEVGALLLVVPFLVACAITAGDALPAVGDAVLPGISGLGDPAFYLGALGVSLVLYLGAVALGLAAVCTLPRVLARVLVPGRVHPLYGVAHACQRAVSRVTNVPFFVRLLGDSSYVVGYLRALGYAMTDAGQTGSNVGAELRHENPYSITVGAGTMLSDGVDLVNTEQSATAFRTEHLAIGSRCFLGNVISVPPGARLDDDVFIGSKTSIPADGRVRSGIGLLGSPAFEIPRRRADEADFALSRTGLRRRLAQKNAHNLRTIVLFLLAQWVRVALLTILALVAVNLDDTVGISVVACAVLVAGPLNLAYGVLLERLSTRFRALRPQYCSIYDPYFWRHERFWKFSMQPSVLNGTPFKSTVWRLLGVRVGRRLFDDGASISEKSLVALGDDVTLNDGVVLQPHSMEDGVFKAAPIVVGSGAELEPLAFVHYDTVLGTGSRLGGNAFLTKGQQVPPGARWMGNPAEEVAGSRHPVS